VPTLWLIGMMGAGKSTVGPLAAGALDLPFIDLDQRVEEEAGTTVAEIFAAEGEIGFRRRERAAVAAAAGSPAVVACGGGVVLAGENVARLRASGVVFWLDAPVGELAGRVGTGAGRPLLAGSAEGGRLGTVLAARAAAYAAAAHPRVETAGRRPEEVAEEVVRLWKRGK
jgi:shikimate kinase